MNTYNRVISLIGLIIISACGGGGGGSGSSGGDGYGSGGGNANNAPTINKTLRDDVEHTNKFEFNEPTEAQLISSSLGTNNEILLRYLYRGKNTLVVIDVKTKKIKSIVTLKKGQNSFKINK